MSYRRNLALFATPLVISDVPEAAALNDELRRALEQHRSGHANEFHSHPGAYWSGVYYVDDGGIAADPSLGGELEFMDPRGPAPLMNAPHLRMSAGPPVECDQSYRLGGRRRRGTALGLPGAAASPEASVNAHSSKAFPLNFIAARERPPMGRPSCACNEGKECYGKVVTVVVVFGAVAAGATATSR